MTADHRILFSGVLATTVLLTACTGDTPDDGATDDPATGGRRVDLTVTQSCATPGDLDGGTVTMDVTNRTGTVADVYVVPETGTDGSAVDVGSEENPPVVAELDQIDVAGDRSMQLALSDGTYHLLCVADEHRPVSGPTFRVSGSSAPAVEPVTVVGYPELDPLTVSYADTLMGHVPALSDAVGALQASLAAGDRGQAKTDWTSAYTAWLALSGGHDGIEQGEDIGALSDERHPDADTEATGLHLIQQGLWHDTPTEELTGPAGELKDAVDSIDEISVGTLDLGIRTHEIVEDSQRLVLTGRSDFGAHVYAAAVAAQARATAELVDTVGPLLDPETTDTARRAADELATTADSLTRYDGTPYDQWPAEARATLNSAVDAELTAVAPVATRLEIRRTHGRTPDTSRRDADRADHAGAVTGHHRDAAQNPTSDADREK